MAKPMIEFDMRDFKKSAIKFMRNDYPEAVANFTKILATSVQKKEQKNLPKDLNLRSGWIPKNINAFPKTRGQVNKIKKDIRSKSKFISSVSGSERIAFMTGHNEGMVRKTQANWQFGPDRITGRLALPSKTIKQRKYITKTGRVKNQYYPTRMMKDWKGHRGPKPGKRQRKPFLMNLPKSGMPAIVRRKSIGKPKEIEVLWFFGKRAYIKKDWMFDEVGLREIKRRYNNAFLTAWKGI